MLQFQFWKRLVPSQSLHFPSPRASTALLVSPFVLVVAKERHITVLDADMVIIQGQLEEKDSLMVDIVRLLDSNIFTKFNGVKRQLEVRYLKK